MTKVVLVYLQIAIHINAVGLAAMTLLGHATWLLAMLLLSVAPRREDVKTSGQCETRYDCSHLYISMIFRVYIQDHIYPVDIE